MVVVFELALVVTSRTDLNEAFVDCNQELVQLVHLYLLDEYFDDSIPLPTERYYCLGAIRFHRHGFLVVDRKMMALYDCVVMVDFRNAVYVPRIMLNLHAVVVVVVDVGRQLLSELTIDSVGS